MILSNCSRDKSFPGGDTLYAVETRLRLVDIQSFKIETKYVTHEINLLALGIQEKMAGPSETLPFLGD